jgi:2',3'-cyclic-nucleotide 2'-phosphodiesterase (5'-nucleotidase family)
MPRPLLPGRRSAFLLLVAVLLAPLLAPGPARAQDGPLSRVGTFSTGIFDEGAAEIAAYDAAGGRLFFVNADANEVVALDIADPSGLADRDPAFTIDVEGAVAGGTANSVAVSGGTVAVAVEADAATANGFVVFYDAADGSLLNQVEVGVLPDHVAFTEDGSAVVTANEGEPLEDYSADPEGSVSVVDLSGGVASASVATAGFTAFNADKATLQGEGVRIFGGVAPLGTVESFTDADPASITVADASAVEAGDWITVASDEDPIPYQVASVGGATLTFTSAFDDDTDLSGDLVAYLADGSATVAEDLEPEYVTTAGATAYVTLQENNALAVVDISDPANPVVTDVAALGTKDHSAAGNGLDPSNDDGGINIAPQPLKGLYQPDAITAVDVGGTTYLLTANEGDAREYDAFVEEVDVDALQLDAALDPSLKDDENLGGLATTVTEGDTDGDGQVEAIFSYGARSFSVWEAATLSLAYDSGDLLEQQTAAAFPEHFNSDNDEQPSFEGRSDNKGPEPEAVEVGVVNGVPHAFVGLERIGGVMVFDLSDPAAPAFVQYVNNRDFGVVFSGEDNDEPTADEVLAAGDLGPESIVFIDAADSPTAAPLVAVSNEVSGSVTLYEAAPQTIAEARSAATGEAVTTEGIVTRALGAAVRIQDDTGGLVVRAAGGPQSTAFQAAVADGRIRAGTRLRVTGSLSATSGRLEVAGAGLAGFAVAEQGVPLPDPQAATLADLAGGEALESELVRVANLTVDPAGDATFQAGTAYAVSDDQGGAGTLFVPAAGETELDGTPLPDAPVTFTGVLGQDNGGQARGVDDGYRLVAVRTTDLQENFPLQILHVSDLEGGGGGGDAVGLGGGDIGDAPRFSALVNALRSEFPENTLVLSSGDNVLPGPVFAAAGDDEVGAVIGEAGLGRADIFMMNEMGFDASTVGNHEFDQGSDRLFGIIAPDGGYAGTAFPYLSANLAFDDIPGEDEDLFSLFDGQSAQPPEGSKIAPSVIVEVGGRSVGIVGATTPELKTVSSPGGDVRFRPNDAPQQAVADLVTAVQDEVDALTDQGVDIVIAVTHLQEFTNERDQLAPEIENVDVIVAGGSDRLLTDGDDRLRPGDDPTPTADVAYPTVVQDKAGEDVLIVSTDGQYKYLGRLVVSFDDAGKLLTNDGSPFVDGEPLYTDPAESGPFATDAPSVEAVAGASIGALVANETVDPEVLATADAVEAVLTQKLARTFGTTDVFLNGLRDDVRSQETNLGNLTADANLAYARAVDTGVEASIKNGGGIRAPIGSVDPETGDRLPPQPVGPRAEGEVSQLDVEGTLRFNNGLTVLEITAEALKRNLENGVSRVEDRSGRFPQVGGLAFSFDPARPAIEFTVNDDGSATVTREGERIRTVALIDAEGNTIEKLVDNGTVLDPDRPVKIVTLGFLAAFNGDDYFRFSTPLSTRDLTAESLPADLLGGDGVEGVTTEGGPGAEQDALAEYMAANFSAAPFDRAETPRELDERIQNLEFRTDTVPVELAAFSGASTGQAITLSWTTASETDNAGFEVEHRPPGQEGFTAIGYRRGSGTTAEARQYRFRLAEAAFGRHRFRLRQVDTDGTAALSETIDVDVRPTGAFELSEAYPNPMRSGARLDLAVREGQPVRAELFNVLGQRVATLHDGRVNASEPLAIRVRDAGLSSGVYFVRVTGDTFTATRRLSVVR